jgi:hypothetical protein
MKRIEIKRDANDKVTFTPVSIDNTENVFFINLDPKQPHKPSILHLVSSEQLGPYPSPNSSQVPVPVPQVTNPKPPPATIPQLPPYQYDYTCQVAGHENEKGTIFVFAPLAAAAQTTLVMNPGVFLNAPLVVGGQPPYVVTGLIVNNKSIPGTSTKPDQMLPIGSDFKLNQNSHGIFVFGNPTLMTIYHFTFTVNDSMGSNLQQVQYTITPPEPASPLEL